EHFTDGLQHLNEPPLRQSAEVLVDTTHQLLNLLLRRVQLVQILFPDGPVGTLLTEGEETGCRRFVVFEGPTELRVGCLWRLGWGPVRRSRVSGAGAGRTLQHGATAAPAGPLGRDRRPSRYRLSYPPPAGAVSPPGWSACLVPWRRP